MSFNLARQLKRGKMPRLYELLKIRHHADPDPDARAQAEIQKVLDHAFGHLAHHYYGTKNAALRALVRLQSEAFDFYDGVLHSQANPDVAKLEKILRDIDAEMTRLARKADDIADGAPKLDLPLSPPPAKAWDDPAPRPEPRRAVPPAPRTELDPDRLGPAAPPLELDDGPQPTRPLDPGGWTEEELAANAARVGRRDRYGAPSTTRGGTEARTGMHYREYNAAEVAIRLRIDYDPEAGRPRSITYDVHSAAESSTQQSSRRFRRDPTTEGAQPRDADFTRTGMERGHGAPREVGLGDPEVERALDQTTNVTPMSPNLNRGAGSPWRASERAALRWARQYGYVTVRIEPVYLPNPPRLPSGVPIPHAYRRRTIAPDGRVLEDLSFLNR